MKTLRFTMLMFWALFGIRVSAQNATFSVEFTAFKYDAKGAYTLIHDDFGTAWGIEKYVDSIAYHRKIPIAFGVITSACKSTHWESARQMMQHGHELINHSHRHYCGLPVDWCPSEIYTEKDYPIEFDTSTQIITKETGFRPTFYIFPFDLYKNEMFEYLEKIQFLGARGGTKSKLNTSETNDFFRLNFHVYFPNDSVKTLNQLAQKAIDQKQWAIRAMHGVGDNSWGVVSVKDYQNHVDFLAQKVKENELWVVNPSEIIKYQINKLKYEPQPKITKKGSKIIFLDKNETQKSSNEAITLKIRFVSNPKKGLNIEQNGKKISFRKQGKNIILCEILPSAGELQIR